MRLYVGINKIHTAAIPLDRRRVDILHFDRKKLPPATAIFLNRRRGDFALYKTDA